MLINSDAYDVFISDILYEYNLFFNRSPRLNGPEERKKKS